MDVKYMVVGPYQTNCYFIIDEETKATAVVDPGSAASEILRNVKEQGLDIKMILLTHGHFDHTGAVAELHEATGAPVYMNERDLYNYETKPENLEIINYGDGDELTLGSMKIKVIETPGHTPGSVSLIVEDQLFCGDTLFMGSCGRTDFPGGSYPQILRSLKRLYDLEGNYIVYPGHDRVTSLDFERAHNPYMRECLKAE